METKIKYYQLAYKDNNFIKLISPSRNKINDLLNNGYILFGFDNVKDIPKNPIVENSVLREKTDEEIQTELDNIKLNRNSFTTNQIETAFKLLNKEQELVDLINSNEKFKLYWDLSPIIRLDHDLTKEALSGFTEQEINNIKLAII